MDIGAIITAIVASGGFWAVINALVAAWLDRRRAKREASSISPDAFSAHGRALRGLLYAELERLCTMYLKRGWITAPELNDLRQYFYEPYHDGLGGDGTIEGLFKRVCDLPVQ